MIWVILAAMTALAVAGLLRPLLKPVTQAAARVEYDMAVYGDQLDEIARDVERGVLSAAEAEAARTEIQRRMLAAAETGGTPKTSASDGKATRRAAMIIATLLPLGALAVYGLLGIPGLPDRPYSERAAQIAAMKEQSQTIEAMVAKLAERLKQDPTDGKGWAMLGRSYRALGQHEDAVTAYQNAVNLQPKDVASRVEYASLLLDMAEGGKLPGDVVDLMNEVNTLDPEQPDALYFLGLDAAMKGQMPRAKALWTRLLAVLPADSPGRDHVRQQLEALK